MKNSYTVELFQPDDSVTCLITSNRLILAADLFHYLCFILTNHRKNFSIVLKNNKTKNILEKVIRDDEYISRM